MLDAPRTSIVHGDLGRAHVLCDSGAVSGVIDWADVHVGDPAIDLAWALHDNGSAFADGLAEAYGVSADERARALDWHLLGPWYEVSYGLDNSLPELVDSGMRGVIKRLSTSRSGNAPESR
ncbi:MAG: phosphotransferase [Actinomycetia bacterium]|nr:phosphotransferase [Actinomycetes bacterium]